MTNIRQFVSKIIGDSPITNDSPLTLKIYAIKDNKAGTFAVPFIQPTDVHALRLFKIEVNRPDAELLLRSHPQDFELHRLGHINQATGHVAKAHELLATAVAVLNQGDK